MSEGTMYAAMRTSPPIGTEAPPRSGPPPNPGRTVFVYRYPGLLTARRRTDDGWEGYCYWMGWDQTHYRLQADWVPFKFIEPAGPAECPPTREAAERTWP